MKAIHFLQILFFLITLLVLVKPLGWYIARIYEGDNWKMGRLIAPFERLLYKWCRIDPAQEMNWKHYLSAMLLFNVLGFFVVYLIQRMQWYLPLNPQHLPGVPPVLSFNAAISFITNTNWQSYSGEDTMSYFTQMIALAVQNFLSAATGMSLLVALIRGIIRYERTTIGNFWVDTIRGILYILLPLSVILAFILVSQGVIQNFSANQNITGLEASMLSEPRGGSQVIPMGPVASQVAIKQLGTNGGGFFNVNAAHPFENPNPFTNFIEMLAMVLIPGALCYTYGIMVKDRRQGWALFSIMYAMLMCLAGCAALIEMRGNPRLDTLMINQSSSNPLAAIGNMEGKETRFGAVASAAWATTTTATASGSVNAMLDSFMPLSSFIQLLMMHFNEVIFGGVGSGLSGMLMFVMVTVFITGLMVGRTPEYLGKKIEPYEMKMASLTVLIIPLFPLIFIAIASVCHFGTDSLSNPGPHGFTQILYAFTSMGNNNGSAFAGLNANTNFYNIAGAFAMLISRYWMAIPTLAIAGSLVKKKRIPDSAGTLQNYTPLFIVLLVSIIFIFGALSFIPVLTLGPIIEHILLWEPYGH